MGDRKGIQPVKKAASRFVGGDDLTGALYNLYLQQFGCHNHLHHPLLQQTPANPGSPGKWPLKRRERERDHHHRHQCQQN